MVKKRSKSRGQLFKLATRRANELLKSPELQAAIRKALRDGYLQAMKDTQDALAYKTQQPDEKE